MVALQVIIDPSMSRVIVWLPSVNFDLYKAFSCQKFEFGLAHRKEVIAVSDKPMEVHHKHEEVRRVVLEDLIELDERGVPTYASIHFHLNCAGMDQTFIFTTQED